MSRPLVILVLTYPHATYPHLTELVRNNPEADIRLVVNNNADNRVAWRNCDRAVHQWWKAYRHTVAPNSRIVLLEQDVLVTKPLPDISTLGIAGAELKTTSDWYWWNTDAPKFPEELQPHICGLVPFAVVFTSPHVMDKIFNVANDPVFELDVICEMRFATLAKAAGVPVETAHLPGVKWDSQSYDYADPVVRSWGIYHSVKQPVTLPDL